MNYPTRIGSNDVLPPENDRDHNFCRNPDNDPNGPWCYAFSKSWGKAYCDIPFCPGVEPNYNQIRPMETSTQMPNVFQTDYTSTEVQTTISHPKNENVRPMMQMAVNIPVKSTSRPTTRPRRQSWADTRTLTSLHLKI